MTGVNLSGQAAPCDPFRVCWTGSHPKIEILAHRANPGGYDALVSFLSARDAYEIALAAGEGALLLTDNTEFPNLPVEWRGRIVNSDDVLAALLQGGYVGLGDVSAAVAESTGGFSNRLSPTPAPLDHPLMLTWGTLRRWEGGGLLRPLADTVPKLLVSPLAADQLRAALVERNAYTRALDAVEELRQRLAAALEAGRVELAPVEADAFPSAGEKEIDETIIPEEDSRDVAGFWREMTGGLEARYQSAVRAGAMFWADDAAAHLYLDPFGPFVTDSSEIVSRQAELRQAIPELRVIGIADVLAWLERQGRISSDERIRRLADLAAHGRTFLFTEEVLGWAVRATLGPDAGTVGIGREVLDGLSRALSALPIEGAARYCPTVANSVAAAVALTSIGRTDDGQVRSGVGLLLDAFRPWVQSDHPFARLNSVAFWQFLGLSLLPHVADHAEVPLTHVLQYINAAPREFAFLRETVPSLIDGLIRSKSGLEAEHAAVSEVRMLCTLLFKAIGKATATLEGEWDVPIHPEIIRLAAPIFDMEVNFVGQVTLESPSGPVAVEVDLEQAEIDAASRLESAAAGRPADSDSVSSPSLGIRAPLEVEYPPASGRKVLIPVDVKSIHLLHRVSARVRGELVRSLQRYFEQSNQADFAEILSLHSDEVLSEDRGRAARGRAEFFRDLLLSPRTWVEVDLGTFFMLLHAAPLEQLDAIAGRPEPWREGEVLSGRLLRQLSSTTDQDAQRRSLASAWGPFNVVLSLLRDFIALRSNAASEDYPRMLLQHAVDESEDPYVRMFELGLLLGKLEQIPEFRDLPWQERTTIGAAACDLLNHWLGFRGASAPLILAPTPEGPAPAVPEEFRLHSLVYRLVFRSVLTERHLMQAVARAGTGDDALGDLLLAGHLLTAVAFAGAASRAATHGTGAIISELERLLAQHPLVRGSNPTNERFLPDSLGVDPPHVNPYLATLLALLESPALMQPSASALTAADTAANVPFWWPHVRGAVSLMAAHDFVPPPQLTDVSPVVAPDRFEVIVTEPVELRALRLVKRYGGSQCAVNPSEFSLD